MANHSPDHLPSCVLATLRRCRGGYNPFKRALAQEPRFALAGFAEHALIDLLKGDGVDGSGTGIRLVRAAATPTGASGPCLSAAVSGIPLRYPEGHPALQAVERIGTVRAVAIGARVAGREKSQPASQAQIDDWAAARRRPEGTAHGLCTVLRSPVAAPWAC